MRVTPVPLYLGLTVILVVLLDLYTVKLYADRAAPVQAAQASEGPGGAAPSPPTPRNLAPADPKPSKEQDPAGLVPPPPPPPPGPADFLLIVTQALEAKKKEAEGKKEKLFDGLRITSVTV